MVEIWVDGKLIEDTGEQSLEEINCDMVRSLKSRGMVYEAKQLLNSHYANLRKLKESIIREEKAKADKIRRTMLKSEGLCVICAGKNDRVGFAKCSACAERACETKKKKESEAVLLEKAKKILDAVEDLDEVSEYNRRLLRKAMKLK
jgi:hypothetical protein